MTILVTGATGNIGRKVVDHLLARGAQDVRALTAKPDKAALPPEVEVHRGYLGDLDSLDGVFDGVTRMYLAPVEETAEQVCGIAADAGVRHIVDLSGPEDSWWGAVRTAAESTDASWTHLEPGEFTENVTIWSDQIRQTGQVRDAFGGTANALISMNDIAEVAAAILLSGDERGVAHEYGRATLPMAGPQLLSKREKVAAIAEGLGRDLEYIEVSRSEAIEILTPSMGEYAEWYVGVAEETHDAGPEAQQVVPCVTGRPATTLTEWVRANSHKFT